MHLPKLYQEKSKISNQKKKKKRKKKEISWANVASIYVQVGNQAPVKFSIEILW